MPSPRSAKGAASCRSEKAMKQLLDSPGYVDKGRRLVTNDSERPSKRKCAQASRPKRVCSTSAARKAFAISEGVGVKRAISDQKKIHGEDPG